jgi:hypothetical protein
MPKGSHAPSLRQESFPFVLNRQRRALQAAAAANRVPQRACPAGAARRAHLTSSDPAQEHANTYRPGRHGRTREPALCFTAVATRDEPCWWRKQRRRPPRTWRGGGCAVVVRIEQIKGRTL